MASLQSAWISPFHLNTTKSTYGHTTTKQPWRRQPAVQTNGEDRLTAAPISLLSKRCSTLQLLRHNHHILEPPLAPLLPSLWTEIPPPLRHLQFNHQHDGKEIKNPTENFQSRAPPSYNGFDIFNAAGAFKCFGIWWIEAPVKGEMGN